MPAQSRPLQENVEGSFDPGRRFAQESGVPLIVLDQAHCLPRWTCGSAFHADSRPQLRFQGMQSEPRDGPA